MENSPHRIRTQRWQVRTGTADAFAWRKLLHEHGEELLLPVLEKAFDEAAAGDYAIHIPRLELKVRAGAEIPTAEALSEMIRRQIQEQLAEYLRREESPPRPEERKTTVPESRWDGLLHYLRTGVLPWAIRISSPPETARSLAESCRDQLPRLFEEARRSAGAEFHFRLLQLLSPEESARLVRSLADLFPTGLRESFFEVLLVLFTREEAVPGRHAQLRLASALLSEAIREGERADFPRVFARVAGEMPAEGRQLLDRLLSFLSLPAAALLQRESGGCQKTGDGPTASGTEEKGLRPGNRLRAMAGPGGEDASIASIRAGGRTQAVEGPSGEEGSIASCRPGGAKEDGRVFREGTDSDLFPLLVEGAGLVLLHPFLPRFLGSTGVAESEEKREISTQALPRAAALLHFLVTGEEEIYEFELVLVKVLLGLHPRTPLPAGPGLLKPEDRREAEILLKSAVHHWGALKKTSVEGLRTSFLQRQGLLREEEYGWKLQVERKTYDILLDQLPWGIGPVRLPWMKRAIHIEW